MRRRARHRLIGAAVLVLAAVIGFPLLFDTQPRPVSVDVPISIPDRNKTKPPTLPAGGTAVAPASLASRSVSVEPKPDRTAPAGPDQEPVAADAVPAKPESKPAPKTEPKVTARPESRVEVSKPAAHADSGDRARALLEGRVSPATNQVSERLVVQVGAFSDVEKARDARQKLEKAGFKTYTQVIESKDGKRVRVRVGPFASKAEADKAAGKVRKLDLPAAVLTL